MERLKMPCSIFWTSLFALSILLYLSQAAVPALANDSEGTGGGTTVTGKRAGMGSPAGEIPLKREDWERLNRVVHETVKRYAVGRKFIEVYGPLGEGAQSVSSDTYPEPSLANVDMLGESNGAVRTLKRDVVKLPLLYKDFWLYWRDIEAACRCDTPLDVSTAVAAAIATASREDDLIFNGSGDAGCGLLNFPGRQTVKISDWSVVGGGFQDVVHATEKLYSTGYYGPYALVLSPKLYAQISRVFDRTGRLEIEGIKEIVEGGVYQSYVFKKDAAVVVSLGRHNLDLAVGTNPHVEYWGPENLNHRFRVVESAVLRVKCAKAICTIE